MNNIGIYLWIPFIVVAIIDFGWYMSLTPKQKKNKDLMALGIFLFGFMVSFLPWCFREVYRQNDWDYLKFKIADHTLFAVIFGTIGAMFAVITLTVFAYLATNQNKKKK